MIDTPFQAVRRDPGGGTRVPEGARLDAPGTWTSRSGAFLRPASRRSERARAGNAWKNALNHDNLAGGRPSGECWITTSGPTQPMAVNRPPWSTSTALKPVSRCRQ